MAKLIIVFVCLSLALFGSSQSTSFKCEYKIQGYGTLGIIYHCEVKNGVNITSLDAAQIDDISGTHKAGYNDDNVEGFSVSKSQIYYFPRGLNKFFKNLKGIQIYSTGLKEIHQNDLKDFPKLANLYLYSSNLEVIEKNLFEFNPNLELIFLSSNNISHIDPNVFDMLTELKSLYLNTNTCIDIKADNNPTEFQKVIKTAKAQCANSEYKKLEQKVKNLEIESKNSNSENFIEKLENLKFEVKNSQFSNTFYRRLEDLCAVLGKMTQDEAKATRTIKTEACSELESKVVRFATILNELVNQNGNGRNKIAFKDDLNNQTKALDLKLEILNENVENSRTASLREINNLRNEVKTDHAEILDALQLRTDKIDKIEKQIKEQNEIFEEKLTKIMKVLHIKV